MKEIAKNTYYELYYDQFSNWIHWTMKGYWKDMSVVPNFNADWKNVISTAKTPFKIFANLSELKAMPDDVKAANDQMQQHLMQNGCIKVSCLMDSAATKLSLNQVIKESGMEKMVKYFTSSESDEAKEWLKE